MGMMKEKSAPQNDSIQEPKAKKAKKKEEGDLTEQSAMLKAKKKKESVQSSQSAPQQAKKKEEGNLTEKAPQNKDLHAVIMSMMREKSAQQNDSIQEPKAKKKEE